MSNSYRDGEGRSLDIDPTHGDLSADSELLQTGMDRARAEIERLRRLRARGYTPLKIVGEGMLPTKAYDGDAGFDLYVHSSPREDGVWALPPGTFVDIDTGVRAELPSGVWAMMVGRSSTARRGLMVAQAVIDNGYRGPLFFGVTNLTPQRIDIYPGERLAQLIPFELVAANMEVIRVEQLADSERGTRGFGSSGR